eukprot:gene14160-biopygen17083
MPLQKPLHTAARRSGRNGRGRVPRTRRGRALGRFPQHRCTPLYTVARRCAPLQPPAVANTASRRHKCQGTSSLPPRPTQTRPAAGTRVRRPLAGRCSRPAGVWASSRGRNGSGRGPDAGRTTAFKETDAGRARTGRGQSRLSHSTFAAVWRGPPGRARPAT